MFPIPPTDLPANTVALEHVQSDSFWFKGEWTAHPEHMCRQTFELSLPHVSSFRMAIDVGCRDGEFTRYLQQQFTHIYCFDPRPRKAFAHNVDTSRVTHFTCALGDAAGEIMMYGGTHDPEFSIPTVRRCFTLDSFDLLDLDYIKLDVEGFEKKVMIGGERTIQRWRPVIVIEQNDAQLAGEHPFAAKAWLEERDYVHVATCPRGWDHIMVPRERRDS